MTNWPKSDSKEGIEAKNIQRRMHKCVGLLEKDSICGIEVKEDVRDYFDTKLKYQVVIFLHKEQYIY